MLDLMEKIQIQKFLKPQHLENLKKQFKYTCSNTSNKNGYCITLCICWWLGNWIRLILTSTILRYSFDTAKKVI